VGWCNFGAYSLLETELVDEIRSGEIMSEFEEGVLGEVSLDETAGKVENLTRIPQKLGEAT